MESIRSSIWKCHFAPGLSLKRRVAASGMLMWCGEECVLSEYLNIVSVSTRAARLVIGTQLLGIGEPEMGRYGGLPLWAAFLGPWGLHPAKPLCPGPENFVHIRLPSILCAPRRPGACMRLGEPPGRARPSGGWG